MGKKKKSGRKDHSTTEKIILVTAIIQLIEEIDKFDEIIH